MTTGDAGNGILEWGVGEARPKGPTAGMGILAKGIASPSPPTRGFAGTLHAPSVGSGLRPDAEGFSCILSRQIAFPSISVRK